MLSRGAPGEVEIEGALPPGRAPRAEKEEGFGLHPMGKRTNDCQRLKVNSPWRDVADAPALAIDGTTYFMTTLEIKGDWNITKGKLRQKWATLTDNDLRYVQGQGEELLGRIQKRTGETREAVEQAIKESNSTCCS